MTNKEYSGAIVGVGRFGGIMLIDGRREHLGSTSAYICVQCFFIFIVLSSDKVLGRSHLGRNSENDREGRHTYLLESSVQCGENKYKNKHNFSDQ